MNFPHPGEVYLSDAKVLYLCSTDQAQAGTTEEVYSTKEGPVVITTRGKLVFVAESFNLDLARKLTSLILDAQGTGEMKMAKTTPGASSLRFVSGSRVETAGAPEPVLSLSKARPELAEGGLASETWEPLTADLIRFFSNCGAMKAAVDAAVQAGR